MEETAKEKKGQKVTILGAGAFGTALGGVLEENGYEIAYYDPILEGLLEDALEGAETLVLAVPSTAILEVVPKLPKELPLIVATKGLLGTEPFAEFREFEILSGPAFARELKEHRETRLTATGKIVSEMFGRPYLEFELTTDKKGVLLCGSLKNVYAILAGKTGLEPGTKEMEAFLAEVIEEMQDVLEANRAERATAKLSCGIGDLALTCSEGSRNFRFGQRLRTGKEAQTEETVEGVSTLKRIERGELEVPAEALRLRELLEESKTWE